MTTIVNSAAPTPTSDNGGSGFLIGAVVIVLFVLALLYFGIPALRRAEPVQVNVATPEVNVPAPEVKVPAPQVNIPDEIDVNVNTTP
jgi:phage baseplate assembly protein gpV